MSTKARLPFQLNTDRMVNIGYKSHIKLDKSYMMNHTWSSDVIDTVMNHNRSSVISTLFAKPNWNLSIFDKRNEPIIIDEIKDKNMFIKRNHDMFLWTLDLPLKMPGRPWMIPVELEQFIEFIQKAEKYERLINPGIDDCYAYFCVDQRDVNPGTSQRRPGWHSDSFVTKNTSLLARSGNELKMDSIYLAYDTLPTEFCPGPFTFDKNIDANDNSHVLAHFENTATGKPIMVYPSFHIIKMGPECVHRVGFNQSNRTIKRTFAKLVFSTEIFNRDGNDHNGLYDYNWLMIPRGLERNNSSIIGSTINGTNVSNYKMLTTTEILRRFNDASVDVYRKSNTVKAVPAQKGELLQTELDNFITSYNVAKEGDWKITTPLGDQYFLSSHKMDKYYKYDTKAKMFRSRDVVVKAIMIDRETQIMAPWGYPQYLKPGDYIVNRDSDDIYGVMAKSFTNSFEKISKN